MKITCHLTLVLLLAIAPVSCSKMNVPRDTPSCITKKIRKMQKEEVRNPPASVWQYEYNGQKVYYIPPYCCDRMGELYDEKCKLICHPDGGFTGKGDEKCTDFFDQRKNEKLVWQDDRK